MLRRFSTVFFLCFFVALLSAQDLHFSQFYLNPLASNPAQTGAFEGDLRVSGLYRSQWTSVPVSYRTINAAADMKVRDLGSNLLSAGLLIQHDRAGDAGLSWTQIGVSGAVSRSLNEQNALTVGLGLAVVQRSFDISALSFKNQWAAYPGLYDPSLPSKENFNRSSGLSPTLSGGVNWSFGLSGSRTRVSAGAGVMHLNRPKISFSDSPREHLPMRLAVQLNSAFQLNEFFDLVVFGLMQRMGTAGETIGGGGIRFWLLPGETALQVSVANRLGDAVIPALQYEFGNWTVGLSYDLNISDFEQATNKRGGFEVAVVYRTLPAPAVKTFKSCPIF